MLLFFIRCPWLNLAIHNYIRCYYAAGTITRNCTLIKFQKTAQTFILLYNLHSFVQIFLPKNISQSFGSDVTYLENGNSS